GIRPSLLKNVGIDQKLNHQVPLSLQFRDERGNSVALGQYFDGKPVVLALVYYQCPMLCTEVLNNLLLAAHQMSLKMGEDYRIVTVSIDPRDGSTDALLKHPFTPASTAATSPVKAGTFSPVKICKFTSSP